MKYWSVVLIFCLASCAGADSKVAQPATPLSSDPKVLAEQATEETMAYDAHMGLVDAMWRVGDKLSVANADLCRSRDRVGYIAGLHVASLATTEPMYRRAAASRYPHIARNATIAYVDPGSPAERAGIQAGDVLLAVAGTAIPNKDDLDNDDAQPLIAKALAASRSQPVPLTLERGDRRIVASVTPVPACDYALGMVDGRQVNSYTDDRGIHIHEGMAQLLKSDDELAVIVGHEMAHNICGHLDGSLGMKLALTFGGNGATVPVEEQADYVGLYLMARAGYDIDKAPDLWRRLAATAMREYIDQASDHPAFPVRVVMLNSAISEIRAKEARGLPLVPDGLLAQTTAPGASSFATR